MAKGNGGGGFSTRREAAVEGGNRSLAVLKEIGWVEEFTYGGAHKDKPVAALKTVFEIEGMERPWEDHWPVGPSSQFEVSKDGYTITRTAGAKGLNKKSAAFFFFDALQGTLEEQALDIDEYVPEDDGSVSVEPLEGLSVMLENRPFTNVSGDTKDKKVIAEIVVDAKPAKGGKAKSNGKVSSGGDVEEKTQDAIVALLEEDSTIKKGDLANLIHAAHKKDADVRAMMQLSFKDSWLADDERPWTFDKKRGVLKAAE